MKATMRAYEDTIGGLKSSISNYNEPVGSSVDTSGSTGTTSTGESGYSW